MVQVIRRLAQLREWRQVQRQANSHVGFVPTMGALHDGHLALMRQSMASLPATVVSIFVNPSQFAPHEDLERYPRTFEKDLNKISELADRVGSKVEPVVFMPDVSEMYPSGISLDRTKQTGAFVEVLGLSHQLEGLVRPHFFRGVATVVTKLFNAVQPDAAYFGQKDVQQAVIVRRMARDLLMPVDIVVGETSREPSGLAMSSRNEYLDPDTRLKAAVLHRALSTAKAEFGKGQSSSEKLTELTKSILLSEPIVKEIEYIAITDQETLTPMETAQKGAILSSAIALNSATGSRLRILDNLIL